MDLTKLDLNLLVYLDALLTECHVTNASKQVGLSQSAMSRALSRLRETFEDPLLHKTLHGMERTPLGVQLMPEVRLLLEQIEHTLAIGQRDQFDPGHDARRWVIGADACCMRLFLPGLSLRVRQGAPKSTLVCHRAEEGRLGWLGSRREVDVILSSEWGQGVGEELGRVQELGRDELVVVRSRALGGGAMTREELTKRVHLLWVSHPSHVARVDEELWRQRQRREVFLECEDLDLGLAMVEENRDMVLVLPGVLAKLATAHRPTLEVTALPLALQPLVYRAIWPEEADAATVWLGEQLAALL